MKVRSLINSKSVNTGVIQVNHEHKRYFYSCVFKLKSVSKKNQTLSLAYSAKTIDSRAKMNFLEYNERVQRRKMRYCTSL